MIDLMFKQKTADLVIFLLRKAKGFSDKIPAQYYQDTIKIVMAYQKT